MAVNRLTDGMPVTTEWLNSLVDNINNALSSVDTLNSPKRFVDFYSTFFGASTNDLQVVAERMSGVAAGSTNKVEMTVTFTKEFADSNVIVVATPSFASAGERKGRPFKATASVAGITSKGFELTVGLYNDDQDFHAGKVVTVDYIAIGRRKS